MTGIEISYRNQLLILFKKHKYTGNRYNAYRSNAKCLVAINYLAYKLFNTQYRSLSGDKSVLFQQ